MALSRLFEISRRSLTTYQNALSVASNNITNAQNPNYSRQVANLQSNESQYVNNYEIGNGVTLSDISRVRNEILDRQIRQYTESKENSDYRYTTLSSIESLFSEPSDLGLSNLMKKFFNSWDELAVDPTSIALRNGVVNRAEEMSNKMNSIYSGMDTIRQDLKAELQDNVESMNRLLTDLHEVNKQIYQAHTSNTTANNLLDKRDEILKDLSGYINLNTTINSDNTVSLSIGGVHVVDRTTLTELSVSEVSNGDYTKLQIVSNGDATLSVNNGKVFAVLDNYNSEIPNYLDKIDEIGNTILDEVNNIHSTMQTLEDPPQTGVDFFSSYTAGKLEINLEILEDPRKIAISADGTEGNNEGALALASLGNTDLIDGKTLNESYSNLVSIIANEKSKHIQQTETYELVLQQLEAQFNEKSGVSVDEEMVNVLNYQRSYDASAKLIRIADEILQTILQMV